MQIDIVDIVARRLNGSPPPIVMEDIDDSKSPTVIHPAPRVKHRVKLPNGDTMPRIICYSRGDIVPSDYIKINVTSRSPVEWSRKFSPFILGPVPVKPWFRALQSIDENSDRVHGGAYEAEAAVFENAWQYSKWYRKSHPTMKEWGPWAIEGFNKTMAVRYPMGRGAIPDCAVWDGQLLNYVQARHIIYGPLYEECVLKYARPEFNRLKKMYDDGAKIALFDFDGHGHWLGGLRLRDVIYNRKRKMGHAFILMGMVTGNRFWADPYKPAHEFDCGVPRIKMPYKTGALV